MFWKASFLFLFHVKLLFAFSIVGGRVSRRYGGQFSLNGRNAMPAVIGFPSRQLPYSLIGARSIRQQYAYPLQLNFMSLSIQDISAAIAITYPSVLGVSIDRLRSKLPILKHLHGISPLITILSAAHFASFGISPSTHCFYDTCWTKLLPASLALSLLSPTTESKECGSDDAINQHDGDTSGSAKEEIMAVSVPFILGCLGSILGCLLSFFYCWLGRDNNTRLHKRVFGGRKHFLWKPGHLLIEPLEAAVSAGCLVSSYVGGSFNYFDTARIIHNLPEAKSSAAEMLGDTFGLTAPDILVLPIYFTILSSLSSSNIIYKLFPGRYTTKETPGNFAYDINTDFDDNYLKNPKKNYDLVSNKGNRSLISSLVVVVLVALVWIIVQSSQWIETITIPGVGFAYISIVSCSISQLYYHICRRCFSVHEKDDLALNTLNVRKFTTNMSNVCYYMLLSVIGLSTNLHIALSEGGWSCLSSVLFAAIPILVHFETIIVGSLAVMKIFPHFKSFPLSVEEIVVASSAAICGPATAATLASNLSLKGKKKKHLKGLTLAATVWGIVGDSVGSLVGVSISKALLAITRKA